MGMAYNSSPDANIVGSPVYFFYDCETTGLDANEDRIIELAAVLDTHHLPQSQSHTSTAHHLGRDDDHFTSLCHCTKEINPDSAKLVGLTLADLSSQPKVPAVLEEFFKWISRKVSEVERRQSRLKCTPVLVAHSGTLLDFPVLLAELERVNRGPLDRSPCQLVKTFRTLNLNFADTFFVFKKLSKDTDPILKGLESLSMKAIYEHFFPKKPYEGHRALEDAKALGMIFTESPVSEKIGELQAEIRSTDIVYRRWKQFEMKRAGIHRNKAEDLVRKQIYLQEMEEEYKRAPGDFRHYLRHRADIKRPSDELMEYFSNLKITD